MAIIKYKPTSNGRRNMSSLDLSDRVTKSTPEKSLLAPKKSKGGRNNNGRITTRHQGGGVKQKYRIIDFKRDKDDIPAKVAAIEYDPNRTANIALLHYADGEKRYILAPGDLQVGMTVVSGKAADIKVGNAMELKSMPEGTFVHCVELFPGKGGQMARSAGCSAQILGFDGPYATLRLSSGEIRKVLSNCRATVGIVGNSDWNLVNIGKAGGGEGKEPIGRKSPMTPWGKKAMGVKTRKSKKASSALIMTRRNGK